MNPVKAVSNLLYYTKEIIVFPFRYLLVDMVAAPILKACVFQEAAFSRRLCIKKCFYATC